ncbi:MAG: proline racemase family protein, partial [Candidatus Nanopelagicales bacterium]|nr:proline racemase family protein [Candidatus Nanopelagicales bacterium]
AKACAKRVLHAVDSHTEGMPTRVVVGGVGVVPGATMAERRVHLMEHMDDLRTLLMYEPRGHAAMSGAILQPPSRPDADWGVLYIEVTGCLPMCGHGTIGVATVLVETGMVEVTEPVTTIRLDVPAGLVVAEVAVEDGEARSVTIRNVPSFAYGLDLVVEVPGIGRVTYDMAFGGNFYAIVESEALGVEFSRDNADAIKDVAMRLMAAINEADSPVHPNDPSIRGCKHVQVLAPGSTAQHSRHAMVISPGWFDRSPCGTGTSARMAQLHARGELPLDTDFINESFIGTHFVGRLVEETRVGDFPAVVPTITGRAWITATAQYMLSDDDPFPAGFLL